MKLTIVSCMLIAAATPCNCPTGHTIVPLFPFRPTGLAHKQAAVQQGGAGLQGTGEEILPGGAAVATDTRGCYAVLPQTAVRGECVLCRCVYGTCDQCMSVRRFRFYQGVMTLPLSTSVPRSADEEDGRVCDRECPERAAEIRHKVP